MPVAVHLRAQLAIFFIAFSAFCFGLTPAAAQDVLPVPALTARVMDSTGTLKPEELAALDAKLGAFEQSRGAQLVILMVPTTAPEDITDFAQRVGDSWKIGRKDVGDGLLLVVAKNDRKVRIATTKTLEGAVPDLAARQVIDNVITPRFRQNDFAGGLSLAVDQLMARITGEALPAPAQKRSSTSAAMGGFQWTDMAVFLFFAVPIGARMISGIFGRKLGAMVTGGAVGGLAWLFTGSLLLGAGAMLVAMVFALISSVGALGGLGGLGGLSSGRSTGWSTGGGWGGGRGGGGGFSSGGGGNFGGGGASGGW